MKITYFALSCAIVSGLITFIMWLVRYNMGYSWVFYPEYASIMVWSLFAFIVFFSISFALIDFEISSERRN